MASGQFTFDVISALLISGYLLYSYSNWFRQRIAVTIAVLVAWYFSFLIVLVLPLDVSSTAYKQCILGVQNSNLQEHAGTTDPTPLYPSTVNPVNVITEHDINSTRSNIGANVLNTSNNTTTPPSNQVPECKEPYSLLDEGVLLNLWRVVYWSSQLLTWVILPIMQSYTQAGEFTVWGKLRSALWDNMLYYASLIFIALILVIYIALQPNLGLNWERTKAIAAAASNTWGLFVLVLMLGYGLVEVPRNLWMRTKRGYQLNRAYFKVAKLMTERTDADEALDDALIAANAISTVVGQEDMRRPYVEEILKKIPVELMDRIKRRRTDNPFGSDPPTEKTFIRLHRQVIKALQDHHRTEAQWTDMTQAVFELEDVNRNMISNEHVFKHTMNRPPIPIVVRALYNPTVEWYWKCLVSPILLRAVSVIFMVLSCMIVWSEVTFFSIHPPLSLFAVFVNLAKSSYNYFALECICLITICYLSLCTYYTVFKIRVLNYYYLASNHQSDEYTLLFSGALLCRLTPPLCLNFLSLIHMDSHVINSPVMETAYTRIMGHMDVVSIVSDYFNIYFPIALLALTFSTYFSVGARILSVFGFQQFLDQDSELTQELVEEGKEHIKRERRRIQRMLDSASRRREFAARFGNEDSNRTDGEEDIAAGPTSTNPRFLRQSDIVKPRNTHQEVSSPERSLLHGSSGLYGVGGDSGSNASPSRSDARVDFPVPAMRTTPPRNIFDDL